MCDYITAPEINLILSIQTFQEAIHSQSYQYIIESILPKEIRNSIYDKWREDKILFERNKYIAEMYQRFLENLELLFLLLNAIRLLWLTIF